MRRFLAFIFCLWLPLALMAQDTITVMQYNLLEYGNFNSGFAQCYESNNNTQHKDECIRTLLNYVHPDILTVCEFGATQKLQNDFLKHNLNTGVDYWKTDNILNYAGSNIINHIFYDSRKMELSKHVALRTNPRDTDVYELYLKTESLIAGDTIKLVCIVAHPKAGDYEASRRALMQTTMDYINQHYRNDNVLIMGDFNMYRASESGYQLLTKTYSNPNIRFVDPLALANIGGVGEWNNNSRFAPFHTQSTRSANTQCFSSGGLDDRFDFILMSDEIYMGFNNLKYVNNSYYAVGNDGEHFNQSINQNGNSAVPAEVAQALYDVSDHLPVTMKLRSFVKVGVGENTVNKLKVYPNPTNGVLHVETSDEPIQGQAQYRIDNLLGQTMRMGVLTGDQINVSDLPNGLYFISVNGSVSKFIKTTTLK